MSNFLHRDGLGHEIDFFSLVKDAPVDELSRFLGTFDSYKRSEVLAWMLDAMCNRPEDCVRLFLDRGLACDAPWPYRSLIAGALRACAVVDLLKVLKPAEHDLYASSRLWSQFGAAANEAGSAGLHWTTDQTVAEEFARGKRCTNPNPTLAQAEIPKAHIFAVFLDRNEYEIALDPRRLRKLSKPRAQSPLRRRSVLCGGFYAGELVLAAMLFEASTSYASEFMTTDPLAVLSGIFTLS